jgi:hypothetical protein
MRTVFRAVLIFQLVFPAALALATEPISVELNGGEMLDNRCVLTFVIENKGKDSLDTLRLNMFLFNQENRVYRRMVPEMGPVRGEKTVVKLFPLDGPCSDIRSVLVNDVSACAPIKQDVCLDNLALSSRMPNVRFYK